MRAARVTRTTTGRRGRRVAVVAVGLGLAFATAACGDDDGGDATEQAERQVEAVTGNDDADLKGSSPLDAAAYALVSVLGDRFEDYEIDGDTVRLIAKDGAQLSGSECTIIGAATAADHPDATFVVVADGREVPC